MRLFLRFSRADGRSGPTQPTRVVEPELSAKHSFVEDMLAEAANLATGGCHS
jgi:hypothetical protein